MTVAIISTLEDIWTLAIIHLFLAVLAIYKLFTTEKSQGIKLVWLLLILLVPFVFSIVYLFKLYLEKEKTNR